MKDLPSFLKELELSSKEILKDVEKYKHNEQKLIEYILKNNLIARDEFRKILAEFYSVKEINLNQLQIPRSFIKLIPEETIREKGVVVFHIDKEGASVALSNPRNFQIINWLSIILNKKIVPYFAFHDEIIKILDRNLTEEIVSFEEQINHLIGPGLKSKEAEELPIIKIFDLIISYAAINKASDVHIEPHQNKLFIRFRIDGILHNIITLPKALTNLIITRIKIISKLRTDEHQKPQDGKFKMTYRDEIFDVRVSILPTINGEKAALRILRNLTQSVLLEDLGFMDADLVRLKKSIEKPHGMILSTGPTGSGKTTTLYTILRILNTPEVNISTIEDPVEYELEGINQIQVNPKAGLTFATGLRSIVRQDPDIIMVGEIRDEETAEIAIHSALTGHLVLSTLHTNDAATAFPRLIDFKIKPFLIASSVNIVIGQRLARKICERCIETIEVDRKNYESVIERKYLEEIFSQNKTKILFRGKGCNVCNFTGYNGRVGIYEVLEVNDKIKELIVKKANSNDINQVAITNGMTTMFQDGIRKVLKGLTTLDELIRIVG